MTSICASSREEIYPVFCHILSPTIGRWCPLWATDVNALKDVGIFFDGMIFFRRKLLHYGNHPIKWVRVTGVIVAIDCWGNAANFKRIYTLDDSSGCCIECSAPAPSQAFSTAKNTLTTQIQSDELKIKTSRETNLKANCTSNQHRLEEQNRNSYQSGQVSAGPSVLNPIIPWDKVQIGSVVKIKGKVDTWWDQKRIEIVKLEILNCTDMEVRCWNEVIKFKQDILNKPWVLTQKQENRCRRRANKQLKKSYKS